jgi:hypothetical protein
MNQALYAHMNNKRKMKKKKRNFKRRAWNDVFQALKENNCQSKFLYLPVTFKIKEERCFMVNKTKTFHYH